MFENICPTEWRYLLKHRSLMVEVIGPSSLFFVKALCCTQYAGRVFKIRSLRPRRHYHAKIEVEKDKRTRCFAEFVLDSCKMK